MKSDETSSHLKASEHEIAVIAKIILDLAVVENVDVGVEPQKALERFAHSLKRNMYAFGADLDFFISSAEQVTAEMQDIIKQFNQFTSRVDNLPHRVKSVMNWGEFSFLKEDEWVTLMAEHTKKQAANDAGMAEYIRLKGADLENPTSEELAKIGLHFPEPSPRMNLRNTFFDAVKELTKAFEDAEPMFKFTSISKWWYHKEIIFLMALRASVGGLSRWKEHPIKLVAPKTLKKKRANEVGTKAVRWRDAIEKLHKLFDLQFKNVESNWEYAQEIESRITQHTDTYWDIKLER